MNIGTLENRTLMLDLMLDLFNLNLYTLESGNLITLFLERMFVKFL